VNEEAMAHRRLSRKKKVPKRYKLKIHTEMGAGLNMGYV
jgi:hypothetical protein